MIFSAHLRTSKSVTWCHTAVCIHVWMTWNSARIYRQIKPKYSWKPRKYGPWHGLTASLPLCSFMTVTLWGRHGVHRG